MVYTLRFFSSKCSLFHNSKVFGSCIIHILLQGVLKLKKNNFGAKRLSTVLPRWPLTVFQPLKLCPLAEPQFAEPSAKPSTAVSQTAQPRDSLLLPSVVITACLTLTCVFTRWHLKCTCQLKQLKPSAGTIDFYICPLKLIIHFNIILRRTCNLTPGL